MTLPVRTLRRIPQERKLAGVCAGLARYAGVDPVLVRLGFVVLTFLGGSGLLIYLVAWVVMPKADVSEAYAGSAAPAPRSTILGLVGLAIGAAVVFGDWSIGPRNGLLPLLLIGGAVALLLQRDDATAVPPPSSVPPGMAPPAAGTRAQDMPSSMMPTGMVPPGMAPEREGDTAELAAVGSPFRSSADEPSTPAWASDWYRAQTEARAELGLPPLPPPGQAAAPVPAAPPRPRRRWKGVLVVFVVGLVVLFGATAVGFGAVLSSGAGERTYRPTTWDGVRGSYELGVGELVLDLTALPALPADRTVSLDLGMGQVQVILPPALAVELEGHAGIGQVVPPAGQDESAEGVDATISTVDRGSSTATTAAPGTSSGTVPAPGSGATAAAGGAVLRIEAEVGMGEVEVLRR